MEHKNRGVRLITSGIPTSVGPLTVSQALPVNELRYADPYILLHHAGPQKFEKGQQGHKIEEHPHRGFEPVTFVYSGSVLHRDSLGNTGVIGAGEVQWITSGSGIMHEEGPTPETISEGGELELIQLWINLPAAKKMMPPAYQELHADAIPKVQLLDGGLELAIVSGEALGVKGPATTQTPLFAAMGRFKANAEGEINFINDECMLIYVLGGSITVNGEHVVDDKRLIVFDEAPGPVNIKTNSAGRLLLLSGKPIGEPIATYGPFVMNTEDEIRQTFRDYAGGKFGTIPQAENG